jgi:hypothetical protein
LKRCKDPLPIPIAKKLAKLRKEKVLASVEKQLRNMERGYRNHQYCNGCMGKLFKGKAFEDYGVI